MTRILNTSTSLTGMLWVGVTRGRQVHLGYFKDEVAAAEAYDTGALLHFGEFARTNKMEGLLPHERKTDTP